ncbi:hypothetical protein [Ferruginibacter profundus]
MKRIALYITLAAWCSCSPSSKFTDDWQYQRGAVLTDIKAISLEGFMERWMQNIKLKPGWFDANLNEMHKDTLYTYFKKATLKTPLYYKVRNDDLGTVDYTAVDGELIFEKFKNEIVPQEDKNLVKRFTHMSFDESKRRYNWHYNRQNREIIIDCYWKEHWGFKKIIDKKYTAVYSIDKKAFHP